MLISSAWSFSFLFLLKHIHMQHILFQLLQKNPKWWDIRPPPPFFDATAIISFSRVKYFGTQNNVNTKFLFSNIILRRKCCDQQRLLLSLYSVRNFQRMEPPPLRKNTGHTQEFFMVSVQRCFLRSIPLQRTCQPHSLPPQLVHTNSSDVSDVSYESSLPLSAHSPYTPFLLRLSSTLINHFDCFNLIISIYFRLLSSSYMNKINCRMLNQLNLCRLLQRTENLCMLFLCNYDTTCMQFCFEICSAFI